MSMQTPLGRVRGLGPARSGTSHFWWQRLTSVANIFLTLFLLFSIVLHVGDDYQSVRAYLGSPFVGIGLMLLASYAAPQLLYRRTNGRWLLAALPLLKPIALLVRPLRRDKPEEENGSSTEEDLEALDAYLKSLRPVPSPYLVSGALSPAAQRGRAVFEKALCHKCHDGPYHTDLKPYDLGLATGQDQGRPMDTPTLVEVWRTAPYLHDGRAATLRDVLTIENRDDRHGATSHLSGEELRDLVAFLLSL